jgi:Zn-dependent metalloprotease
VLTPAQVPEAPIASPDHARNQVEGDSLVKLLKQGLCLALLGAGLAAVPLVSSPAAGQATTPRSLVSQMRAAAGGDVKVSAEAATGRVGFIRAAGSRGDLLPAVSGGSATAAADKARSYLHQYAAAFGARPGELFQSGIVSSRTGWVVSFTQTYKGLPVFGSMLKANVSRRGALTAVSGFAAPGLSLSTTPRLSKSQAGTRALLQVRAHPPGEGHVDLSGVRATDPQLMVYREGSTHQVDGRNILVYVVDVTNGRNIAERVFVDADNGKVVNRYSSIETFKTDREVYETSYDPAHLLWKDGDAFPGTLDQEQQNLAYTSGNVYWLFANTFQRDSYDGAGAKMISVNDYVDPDPNYCPNANWNGTQINVCEATGPDDVIAHEWGHAYTEKTSGLIYQWQSGALNESYSDVWGETIDLINNREDGGEGDLTAHRPVGQCSTHAPPSPVVTIQSPAAIAKECVTGGYLGPKPMPNITGEVATPTDADEDGSDPVATDLDGCSPYDQAVTGKVVLVDRGSCTFVQKAEVARDAGAAALIIGNRDDSPISFSDADQTLAPTASIGLTDRESIRAAVADGQTVNVSITDGSGTRVDSYRWLMGEKAESFDGAIRDMWTPTCFGDPGKVSDVEYKCSSDDSGGVHGNSGVPNHLYALLVDGGTYNGVSVPGIGLDKAASLWWQTQTAHLTPTSDFRDMADGLEASCAELTGQPTPQLVVKRETPATDGPAITAADCAAVAAALEATQMRLDPTEQCDFKPLLAKQAPAPCGKGTRSVKVWGDSFNHGLGKWKQSERTTFKRGHGYQWKRVTSAPHHSSPVAFAADPLEGDCSGGRNDISSRNSLASPRIRIPRGGSPRLTFQHYVASEEGFDGGNVRVKVNGHKWRLVPTSAFAFNGYNSVLEPKRIEGQLYNTNPMGGQPAFTGTDGGTVFGSWGVSQVNLAKMGVGKGDTIRLRFDFGRDGCNGVDGWYVDNVKVLICKKKHARTTALGTKS